MNELLRKDPAALQALYARLGEQVKSYHRHYRMGDNTSIPTETARELLESMIYTLEQSGTTLETGQLLLRGRLEAARKLHRLVEATAPDWQSQYRWDSIQALGRWLDRYDPIHFAHRAPEFLPYPLMTSPPALRGLDSGEYYLRCLWLENQILEAMGRAARGEWENAVPDYWGIPLNLCEQPLIQLLGRSFLGHDLSASSLTWLDRETLLPILRNVSQAALREQTALLCRDLGIRDPHAVSYACAVADSLWPRLRAALPTGDLSHIFL